MILVMSRDAEIRHGSDVAIQDILFEKERSVATLSLNRPEKLNAFRNRTIVEMEKALTDAIEDRSVRVIVLTGVGSEAFSVGGDVSEMKAFSRKTGRIFVQNLAKLGRTFLDCPKPIVARVNGYCLGGGNEIQLFCDLTIASDRSVFGQVGPKVGSVPLWGGTQILPLLVGLKKAKEMIYLCRRYSAAEAVAMGLINEAVPEAELDARVDRICLELIEKSPQSLRLARRSLHRGLKQRIASDLKALGRIYGSPELMEGMKAFLEKRLPKFV